MPMRLYCAGKGRGGKGRADCGKTREAKGAQMTRCTSCGKPFAEHQGIINTCRELQELREAAKEAYTAWEAANEDKLLPDLSNHYTARQTAAGHVHAMLRLGKFVNKETRNVNA